jgi:hypothetical protein
MGALLPAHSSTVGAVLKRHPFVLRLVSVAEPMSGITRRWKRFPLHTSPWYSGSTAAEPTELAPLIFTS